MPANLKRIVARDGEPELLAVAVCKGPHAGIVYRQDEALYLLHFAFHRALKEGLFERWKREYVCVELKLRPAEAVALAGYCRRIYRANAHLNNIPYNLQYDEETGFDPDSGDLILPSSATGMNCATFVLHVFRSAGNRLIDATGWPDARPRDRQRQAEVIQMLRECPHPDYQAQASHIQVEQGCPRISPEEVVGACLEDDLPASFARCEPNGRLIEALLDSWCPSCP